MLSGLGAVISGSVSRASRSMLPFLPGPSPTDGPMVHIVNPLVNAFGGSENRSIELTRALAAVTPTQLWSDRRVDPRVAARTSYKSITPPFAYPRGGNLIFVGVYFRLGAWLRHAKPRRVIAVYNTPDLADLQRFQGEMAEYGLAKQVEFVYASQWLREQAGLPGEVHPSIIDLQRFSPAVEQRSGEPFVVGRLSRDVQEKHHPEDPQLWIDLAQRGFKVRLMGATCIAEGLGGHPGIEVLPAGAEPAEVFMRSLDAFVYRTDNSLFVEPSGRVILEALACGVPVVCDRNGGYREVIVEGSNGLFGDSSGEIIARLESLRADSRLHQALGLQGRRSVEALFSPSALATMQRFFTD